MKKYRKIPVIIEAIQWDGRHETLAILKKQSNDVFMAAGDYIVIKTLEGDMRADIGDFIIKGVKGELYPCKPDIFELTYEEV